LDISGLLDNFLLFARSVIDGDFAILYLPGGSNLMELESSTPLTMWSRKRSSRAQEIYADGIEDILEQVKGSGISRQVDHVLMDFDSSTGRESVWAAPIFVKDGHIVGVLIIGPLKQQALNEQQRLVIDSISGIAALSIQYKELFVQVEYQSVVEERMRLAREMHDGLAQTLAFLKIQASQMQNYLAIGENGKLAAMLQANHRTLADAYVDARQAIDDLRRIPAGKLSDWLSKVAADYRQATLQAVDVRMADLSSEIPANTQAQLIRIVQEALSNVRKHAAASSVRIDGTVAGETLLLEIQDDGCGFTPQSVDGNSRYGLMGMRERAESIGADFQISSEPGLGTVVSLRIPLTAWQERRGDVEHSA
jgi:two-component system nitrate/nitrite sensor histidine kinase NarX